MISDLSFCMYYFGIYPKVTLPISPGRLGLTLQFYKTGVGAMITGVDSACTFKDQVNVGDRLITVDESVISKVEDLSRGKRFECLVSRKKCHMHWLSMGFSTPPTKKELG